MEKIEKVKEEEKKRINLEKTRKYDDQIRTLKLLKEQNMERDFPYKKELELITVHKKGENILEQNHNMLKFSTSPRVPMFLYTKHPTTLKKNIPSEKWVSNESLVHLKTVSKRESPNKSLTLIEELSPTKISGKSFSKSPLANSLPNIRRASYQLPDVTRNLKCVKFSKQKS